MKAVRKTQHVLKEPGPVKNYIPDTESQTNTSQLSNLNTVK